MKLSVLRTASLVLLPFALLAGCSAPGTSPDPSSAVNTPEPGGNAEESIQITDILGRDIELDGPAEEVVLTFNFEEYFAVTGEEGIERVTGWSRQYWEGRRQSTWDVFIEKYPELNDVPDVGYVPGNTLNVETIITLSPDIVIMSKNDHQSAATDLDRLEAAQIPVLFVDYHEQLLENHYNSTVMIGQALGMEARAEEVADFYVDQVSIVRDRIEAQSELPAPRVYVEFSDTAGPEVFGATYGRLMWGAIIEQVGGDNIARDLVDGASAAINPEQIIRTDPEIVIFAGNQYADSDENIGLGYTSDETPAIESLLSYSERPGWSELSAVENGELHALYHDLSRHIFDFAGLQFFAKVIQPDLFEDLEPLASLTEFHERFYPVEYSGTWFVSAPTGN